MAITFTNDQQTAVDATSQTVVWLFNLTLTDTTEYAWSTRYYDGTGILLDEYDEAILDESDESLLSGFTYTSKVGAFRDAFSGLQINRIRSEKSIVSGLSLKFTAHNQNNTLTASDFADAKVVLRLLINDEVIRTHTLIVKTCEPGPQRLRFSCVDYLQKYLEGDYPNTRLVRDIFPEDAADINDNVCVPLAFGTAYVPVRSDYYSSDTKRYYILGQTSNTADYSINAVRSPRAYSNTKSEWTSAGYTFTKYIKADADAVDWCVFEPIILDSDNNGTADAAGFWVSGSHFLDMPCKFSQVTPNLAAMTNPADIIEYILEDFGIPSAMVDTGVGSTFETAGTTFTTRSITYNGAFWYKQPRKKVLAQLLYMCNATLICNEKIELHVLSNTSVNVKAGQANVDNSYILKSGGDRSESTFQYRTLTNISQNDSGVIGYAPNTDAQDRLLTITVPATTTTAAPSGEILEMPFIGNSQVAQKLGILYYGKKFLPSGQVTFTGHSGLLLYQPNDFLTTGGGNYGGTRVSMVDSMFINKDGSIRFTNIEFSATMSDYDWGDLAPGAITHNADSATSPMGISTFGPDASGGISPIYTDNIYEKTTANGVGIDGITIKDGGITLNAGATVNDINDEDNMSSNSATALCTQQSIKAYTDTHAANTITHGTTSAIVGVDDTQTLTNKTLTSPTITSPTINTGVSGTAILNEANMASSSTSKIVYQKPIVSYVSSGTITMTNKTLTSPVINTGVSGTAILNEANMASSSTSKVATQKSIKNYADGLMTTHNSSYTHSDIALNTSHRGTTTGNPHQVSSLNLVSSGTPQSGTYTFGGGSTGDIADMTFSNGILISVTLVS